MELKKVHDTLNWLLAKYLEDPNQASNISNCTQNQCNDLQQIHELGQHLAEKGYVKLHEFTEEGFTCLITMLGINQVSDIFNHVKYQILEGAIERNNRSVMEILGIGPDHFKRVHDYATYLKRLGIIECIFHNNDVHAEPTFYGREWYEQNKPRFVS